MTDELREAVSAAQNLRVALQTGAPEYGYDDWLEMAKTLEKHLLIAFAALAAPPKRTAVPLTDAEIESFVYRSWRSVRASDDEALFREFERAVWAKERDALRSGADVLWAERDALRAERDDREARIDHLKTALAEQHREVLTWERRYMDLLAQYTNAMSLLPPPPICIEAPRKPTGEPQ